MRQRRRCVMLLLMLMSLLTIAVMASTVSAPIPNPPPVEPDFYDDFDNVPFTASVWTNVGHPPSMGNSILNQTSNGNMTSKAKFHHGSAFFNVSMPTTGDGTSIIGFLGNMSNMRLGIYFNYTKKGSISVLSGMIGNGTCPSSQCQNQTIPIGSENMALFHQYEIDWDCNGSCIGATQYLIFFVFKGLSYPIVTSGLLNLIDYVAMPIFLGVNGVPGGLILRADWVIVGNTKLNISTSTTTLTGTSSSTETDTSTTSLTETVTSSARTTTTSTSTSLFSVSATTATSTSITTSLSTTLASTTSTVTVPTTTVLVTTTSTSSFELTNPVTVQQPIYTQVYDTVSLLILAGAGLGGAVLAGGLARAYYGRYKTAWETEQTKGGKEEGEPAQPQIKAE